MRLKAWLEKWQNCSHASDTGRDVYSYLTFNAIFISIAFTRLTGQQVV